MGGHRQWRLTAHQPSIALFSDNTTPNKDHCAKCVPGGEEVPYMHEDPATKSGSGAAREPETLLKDLWANSGPQRLLALAVLVRPR